MSNYFYACLDDHTQLWSAELTQENDFLVAVHGCKLSLHWLVKVANDIAVIV